MTFHFLNLAEIKQRQGFTVTNEACLSVLWLWMNAVIFHTHITTSRQRRISSQRRALCPEKRSCWRWSHLLGAACSRCSGTRVTTRLFLDEAAHTWASLQQGNCVYVHVTWGECEWGADKHPAASRWWDWEHGKQREEGESSGKLNWALNTRGNHSHLHRTSHTHKQTKLGSSPGTCTYREKTLM